MYVNDFLPSPSFRSLVYFDAATFPSVYSNTGGSNWHPSDPRLEPSHALQNNTSISNGYAFDSPLSLSGAHGQEILDIKPEIYTQDVYQAQSNQFSHHFRN